MNRADLKLALEAFHSEYPEELKAREQMLELLQIERCFHRDCWPAHFTGSALVVSADGSQILLNHHRFLNRWMQFGGHCDGDENICRVAAREAGEESGIADLILASKKPFDLDIHPIPENPKKGELPHFHYDVRYVFIAPENAEVQASSESIEVRWFNQDEAARQDLDVSMQRLLKKYGALYRRRAGH